MQNFFFVKNGGENEKILYADVLYFEALKKYIKIATSGRSYLLLTTLNKMENELAEFNFCRVHRSYIIALDHIKSFNNELVRVADKEIPIGRHYRTILSKRVKFLGAA